MENTQTKDYGHVTNLVVGGGIAGLVTALELLQAGHQVTIVEGQANGNLGGLARQAFGGMMLVDTPEQRKMAIKDSPSLALQDWFNYAGFELPLIPADDDPMYWPKTWANYYVSHSVSDVYDYVKGLGCRFLPAVNWVERGDASEGNSVPRYHIIWGTSADLISKIMQALDPFIGQRLTVLYQHKVINLNGDELAVTACDGLINNATPFKFSFDNIVIATGGFTGSIEKVRQHWPTTKEWGKAPSMILNGSHPSADGAMLVQASAIGGRVTNLSNMWNYGAGINHPQPQFSGHGLSLIPCKSALWLDHVGQRIGPMPLITGFNTTSICQRLSQLKQPYSWMILNKRIALKEFAVSGSDHNPAFRDKNFVQMIKDILFGNHWLYQKMVNESDDFIVGENIADLCDKMNRHTKHDHIDVTVLSQTVMDFDNMVKRPKSQWNDDQIRKILHARQWKPDQLRTCAPKPLTDSRFGPLIAIKVSLISRKSLGGLQTNLNSQVLNQQGQVIKGLYGVGEVAGFGGGGCSGQRSLEGTFLSGCILTARQAAKAINNQ